MDLYPPTPEPPDVRTTELDWPDQARSEGWILSNGRWQHDDRAECYDDGDWIYLGDGVWEDAYLASLPADTRRDLMDRYTAVLAETADAVRLNDARDVQRHGDGDH